MKYASLFVLIGLLLTTARVAEVNVPAPTTAFVAPLAGQTAPLQDPILLGKAASLDGLIEISLRF
ncbi:hypothetical protein [Cognatishimia sp. MH4019]|uniref:hypothetical protein n=1 Tax=Cognatishimia sp. MH4019 TaxID=2854030 RepID=UPI001CD78ED2|nr:hypothetical protein [Cognatishimia sp. MH4019]